MASKTYTVVQFVDILLRELQVGTTVLKEGQCVAIINNKVVPANADPDAGTVVPAVGIVARSYQAYEKGCEIFHGLRIGGVSGATAGDRLYLSTDGALQLTKPAKVGWLIQQIGTCYNTGKVRVMVVPYDHVLIEGFTVIVTNGVTVAPGSLVNLTGGEVVLANAATGTAIPVIGIADATVVGNGVLTVGVITNPNEIGYEWTVVGQTVGLSMWLGEGGDAGKLTATRPVTAGDLAQAIAYNASATKAKSAFERGYEKV